ncbi:PAS domain S-box protein [Nostoc sp.]|uniref:PAS domain S-box protein n=1 Tax=Nostoc sp. TaxID=1180 RepID=UPI002FF9DDA9
MIQFHIQQRLINVGLGLAIALILLTGIAAYFHLTWLMGSAYGISFALLVAVYLLGRRADQDCRPTEATLRESEERFRSYFELGLIGMAITSPTKGCLEVNDDICEILGYERHELLQMNWAEITHPDDLAADLAQFNLVVAGEIDAYSLDKRWICKDGRVIDSTISVKCVRREDGSVDYFMALLQDITEAKRVEVVRKQTAAALRESAEQLERQSRLFETTLSALTDNIFTFDKGKRFRYVNLSLERLWGITRDEAVGKTLSELDYPPDLVELLEAQIQQVFDTQQAATGEVPYTSPLGVSGYYEYIFSPVIADGSVELVTGWARDISDRKRVEAERKQAMEALQESGRRFKAVFNQQFQFMAILSPDGRVIEPNNTCLRGTGVLREQVVGRPFWEASWFNQLPLMQERWRQGIAEVASGGGPITGEVDYHTADGDLQYATYAITGLKDDTDQVVEIIVEGEGVEFTQRKRAEIELRASEERYRSLFESIDEGFCLCEMQFDANSKPVDYRFLEINPMFEQQSGLQNATGKTVRELVPNLEEYWFETYGNVVLTGETVRFVKHSDVMNRWFDVCAFRVGGQESQTFAILFTNITDRKRTELALQRSDTKFRAVFDQMYQFLGLLTPDGQIIEVNQNPLTFAQVKWESVIGKPLWEFPSWQATAELQAFIQTAVAEAATGQFFRQDVIVPASTGELHTFDFSLKPIYVDDADHVTWLLAEGRDITPTVRLQTALRQEQERSLHLINSSVDGIVAFDTHGCCTLWNPAMEQLTGLPQEAVVGTCGTDVFSALLDAKTLQRFHPGRDESAADFDFHFTHPATGQRQWIEARYSPLHDGADTPNGGLMMVRDVTKQRELERMKREFISIISHEIRTPLSSIRGALGLIAEGILDNDPAAAKEMLGIANNNIERLVRLVNDILALNRLESGQVDLKRQWCDPTVLVQQAFSNVRALAEAKQITLQSSVSEIQVWADFDWLIQVLVNLINNAVKFSPAGTIISVAAEPQPQQVFFRVIDQGRGIPTEKLDTIFGRFQQVDASDSRQKGGTGLGLSICRLIVQQHGGRIWAESKPGQGSTFYFTLPTP